MKHYRHLLNPTAKRVFLKPRDFLEAAVEYFEWAADNPLQEEVLFHNKGAVVRADADKVRPFTKKGLASYLGIPESRMDTYRNRSGDDAEEWAEVVELIEQTIYNQKFENAAAGLLNASLISRDLGLADKSELSGPGGGPVQTEEVSARDLIASRLAGLASSLAPTGDSEQPE